MRPTPTVETRGWLNLATTIAATIVIAVLVNVLVSGLRWRADLTEHGVNTLSEVSRDAAAALEALEVHLYISPDLPPHLPLGDGTELDLQRLPQALTDKLAEYAAFGAGMRVIRIEEDLIAEAERNRIRTFSGEGGALTATGRFEFKKYALGASFHYKDQVEVLELAIQPEFLEFEITRRLLRLKEKAEFAVALKDVLDAAHAVARAARACASAFGADTEATPTAPFVSREREGQLGELRAVAPAVQETCGGLGAAVATAKAVPSDLDAFHRLTAGADALAKEAGAWTDAVLSREPPEAASLAIARNQIVAFADSLQADLRAVEESPGQRRIGFVCGHGAFCPFGAQSPLIPRELMPADPAQDAQKHRVVAFLTELDQQIATTVGQIRRGLFDGRGYGVVAVDLDLPLPDDLDAVVVFGATRDLSDWQLYQLDQFVLSGGSLVVFVNPADITLQPVGANGRIAPAAIQRHHSNISALLGHFGIMTTGALIAEPTHHGDVTVTRYVPRDGAVVPAETIAVPYPLFPTFTQMAAGDPLVRATPTLTLPYATWFQLKETPSVTSRALVETSTSAVSLANDDFPLDPAQQADALAGRAQGTAMPVVAVATGAARSFFAGRQAPLPPVGDEDDGREPRAPAPHRDGGQIRVLAVGSNLGLGSLDREVIFGGFDAARLSEVDGALVTEVEGYRATYETWSRRLDEVRATLPGNMQFLQSALDWAIQREAVAELRSKQYGARPLRLTDERERTRIRVLGLATAPLLLLLLGVGLLVRRRRRQRRLGR